MKTAFWNVNMGVSSRDKIQTFQGWLYEVAPDLLLLEEVSDTLREGMNELTGMEPLNYVNTLDVNDNPTTKQLWALQKQGQGFQATVLRFPNLEQRRALLKVTHPNKGDFALWVIHANASQRGGAAATEAVNNFLNSNAGNGTIVGGDFNYRIQSAGNNAIHPLNWQGNQLNFTQWNKTDGSTAGPNNHLHITSGGVKIYRKVEPHNVIDYVIKGSSRNVQAINNCISEQRWIDILRNFDHCPVVYDIN